MDNDFRQRVFLPLLMPVGVIVGFFGFAFMLSRVLLAVPEMAATTIALGLATYILALGAIVAAKPRITSRALAVGTTLGIVAIVAAGAVAASAGMRELEHPVEPVEDAVGGPHADDPGGEDVADAAAEDSDQLTFTAVDIDFSEAPTEPVPAGEKQVVLVNEGVSIHNVTIPALGDEPVVEADGGETSTALVELEPGTYEYFCNIPGHESSMEGEFTVE